MKSIGLSWFSENNVKVMAGYFVALFIFAGTILRYRHFDHRLDEHHLNHIHLQPLLHP